MAAGIDFTASSGDLILSDSTVSGNEAPDSLGGGIYAPSGGDVIVERSTISGNTANTVGGVGVQTGSLSVTESTVSGNTVTGIDGGGIRLTDSDDSTITRSTVSGNRATSRGGGISSNGSELTITASTIAGNQATYPGGANGGGLHVLTSAAGDALTIRDSTIAGNSATNVGGAAYLDELGTAPDPALTNTIVADNTASAAPNLFGSWMASFSLIESTVGTTITISVPGSNLTGLDPKLGPLAANSGPTATRRPLTGSPVIDRGATALGTDQRLRPRPLDIPSSGTLRRPARTAPTSVRSSWPATKPGRRPVQVVVRQGPAGTERGAHDGPYGRAGPADGPVLERWHDRSGSGRRAHVRVGLRQQRQRRLHGSEPESHLHRGRRLRRQADGDGLGRQDRHQDGHDHGRQHQPDGHHQHPDRR